MIYFFKSYSLGVIISGLFMISSYNASALSEIPNNLHPKSLKILVAVGRFPVISETFIINQVNELINLGHNVSILVVKQESKNQSDGKVHAEIQKNNLLNRVYWRNLPDDINSYDIILCQFGPLGAIINRLKLKYKFFPKIVTWFRGYGISALVKRNPNYYRELFNCGDFFLTDCEFFKKKAVLLGCPEDRIFVNYTPVDCHFFSKTKNDRIKKESTNEINILTAGRLVEKKGISDALDAIAILHKKNYDIRYTIAGGGSSEIKQQYKEKVKNLGVERIVNFFGEYVGNELKELLKNTDIFLGPSVTAKNGDTDAIPVTLKEAMGMGVPVVSTYHGGIPEMITHGKNGLLVEEHAIQDLANQMEILIRDPNIASKIGFEGRKTVEKSFESKSLNMSLSNYLEKFAAAKPRS